MTKEYTRVLHVLGQFERSGAEMMLLQSAGEWQRHGYKLDLLATGPQAGPMLEPLRAAGYETHHIPFRSSLRYLPSLNFPLRFIHLCRSREFDVLHLHTEAAMPLFVALGLFAGVSTIVRTVHNAFTFKKALRVRKTIERKIARAAGVRFAFVSESVQQVEWKYFGNQGTYTPNWFDTNHFRPPSVEERTAARRVLGCPETATVIVTVGNCNEAKNHEAFLHALVPIAAQQQVLYLHVGRERADGAERRLAASLGLETSVRFSGSHPDPREFLWAADLFAMPSLHEGLSIAALEAVGAGTPALFTNVRGLNDIADKTRWIKQVQPANLTAGLLASSQVPSKLARERALEDSVTIHREFSIGGGVSHLVKVLYQDGHACATTAVSDSGLHTS